jgi:GNAT superfamily N-acetyltransferase
MVQALGPELVMLTRAGLRASLAWRRNAANGPQEDVCRIPSRSGPASEEDWDSAMGLPASEPSERSRLRSGRAGRNSSDRANFLAYHQNIIRLRRHDSSRYLDPAFGFPTMNFAFAPATEAYFEPLLRIRHAAMRPSLEQVGRWHPDRARARFRAAFAPGLTRLILVAGQLAGCVALRPAGDILELDQFYLDPAFQGGGLGSTVLRRLLAEADAAGKPVALTVLKDSAAIRFYERHGFVMTGAEDWDLFYFRPVPVP